MPSPRYSASYLLDLGLKYDGADMTDGDIVNIAAICPYAGVIKAIWAGTGLALATDLALTGVYKAATTPVQLLSAGVDLEGYTVNVAQSVALTATTPNLKVAAGDIIFATYTLSDITAGADSAVCCTVVIEGTEW
jgi:hypothetical protein